MQFDVTDASQSTMADLHDKFWNSAVFPDVVPPACRADFLGAGGGRVHHPGATADKPPFVVDETTLNAFLSRRSSSNTAVTVPVTAARDHVAPQVRDSVVLDVGPDSGAIERVGQGKYPYSPDSLGPPNATGKGEVLDNMEHATFIVTGTFSTDHTGNAVAFANDGNGWAVVKAQSDGNLAPDGTRWGAT